MMRGPGCSVVDRSAGGMSSAEGCSALGWLLSCDGQFFGRLSPWSRFFRREGGRDEEVRDGGGAPEGGGLCQPPASRTIAAAAPPQRQSPGGAEV